MGIPWRANRGCEGPAIDPIVAKPTPLDGAPKTQACKICGESLRSQRTVVQCAKCRTLHHLDCWRFGKGCSVFGCGSRAWEEPTAADALTFPLRFERVAGNVPSRVFGILAILPMFICMMLAIVLAIEVTPLLSLLPGTAFFLFLWCFVRFGVARERLHSDLSRRTLRRTLDLFGMAGALGRQDGWLVAADVVELHLHAIEFSRGGVDHRLYALLTTGERRLIRREIGLDTEPMRAELERLVEGLAVFADCTVRRIRGSLAPSFAEMDEAIAQKRLAAAGPQGALPAPVQKPGVEAVPPAGEGG